MTKAAIGPGAQGSLRSRIAALTLGCCILGAAAAWAQPVPDTINTYAGNGRAPYLDDGKKALDAQLYDIWQIALDGSGNLYFADYYFDRVFKIGSDGVLTAIAGNDQFGWSGDGGIGTGASLYGPRSISAQADGTVYIGDVLNNRIRKVTPDGIISTAAGGGDFYGTGVQGPDALLPCPESVAVSSSGYVGFLTACDFRFLVMYPSGLLYTYGGDGTPGPIHDGTLAYRGPLGRSLNGLAVDDNLNWYIAVDNRIRKIDGRTYVINTIAGGDTPGFSGDGGPATAAQFNTPFRITVDKSGNLYVPDRFNQRIRKIDTQGIVTTIAGNGSGAFAGENAVAAKSPISLPSSVAVDANGTVYFSEQGARRIRKILPNGNMVTVAGRGIPDVGDGGPVAASMLINPYGVAVAPDGTVYLADKDDHRIRRVGPDGIISTVAGTGIPGYSGDNGPALQAQLNGPLALALDANGDLFVSDNGNNVVRMIALDGTITTVAGTGQAGFSGDLNPAAAAQLNSPDGLCFDASGNLYIADYLNHRVRMVDSNGIISTVAGDGTYDNNVDGGMATASSVGAPTDVLFDAAGNLYVSSLAGARVRIISPDGTMNTVAGAGASALADGTSELGNPYGLVLDSQGNLFISEDTGTVKMLSGGILSVVIGNDGDYFGDGGPALSAAVNNPRHMAFLADGSLIVADAANKRIRNVTFMPPPAP